MSRGNVRGAASMQRGVSDIFDNDDVAGLRVGWRVRHRASEQVGIVRGLTDGPVVIMGEDRPENLGTTLALWRPDGDSFDRLTTADRLVPLST